MTSKHDIIWLESIDSTNDEAQRRISGLDNLSVLSALSQTSGRGQRGNPWSSEAGLNLTFSIVLKFMSGTDTPSDGRSVHETLPPLKASDQFVISEIAALSVVELLKTLGVKSEIKWPNDIYVGSKKICGMLIENSLRGNFVKSSIIGIGLNVNQKNFDVLLPNPTSLALTRGKSDDAEDYDIGRILDSYMGIFTSSVNRYFLHDSDSSFDDLRKSYLENMWRINKPSGFIDFTALPSGHSDKPVVAGMANGEGREFTGTIRGLSPVGNLLVEDLDAIALREFSFKEIGYIL